MLKGPTAPDWPVSGSCPWCCKNPPRPTSSWCAGQGLGLRGLLRGRRLTHRLLGLALLYRHGLWEDLLGEALEEPRSRALPHLGREEELGSTALASTSQISRSFCSGSTSRGHNGSHIYLLCASALKTQHGGPDETHVTDGEMEDHECYRLSQECRARERKDKDLTPSCPSLRHDVHSTARHVYVMIYPQLSQDLDFVLPRGGVGPDRMACRTSHVDLFPPHFVPKMTAQCGQQ